MYNLSENINIITKITKILKRQGRKRENEKERERMRKEERERERERKRENRIYEAIRKIFFGFQVNLEG